MSKTAISEVRTNMSEYFLKGVWVSAGTQLPPHEKNVLIGVYHDNSKPETHIGYYNHSKGIWRTEDGERVEDVKVWMLLPELPQEKCGNVGSDRTGKITVICQQPKGHTGNHAGMGCEWGKDSP